MKNALNKKNFLIFLKETSINPKLNLNNLPGEGRTDLLCRLISSTFFLSNSFRSDTNLFIFFQKESIMVVLYGNQIKNLMPDERSIGGFLKKIFKEIMGETQGNIKKSGEYSWDYCSLDDIASTFSDGYILEKNGTIVNDLIDKSEISKIFILGDHIGLNENDISYLTNFHKISLGDKELHASSCIAIIHHYLDKND